MNERHNTVDLGMNFNVKTVYLSLLIVAVCAAKTGAQQVIKTNQGGTIKEVLVVPLSYTVDNFNDIDKVKTGRAAKRKAASFKGQLENIAAKAAKKGGNVLQITRIEDHNQQGRYRFWGEAYSTKEFDRVKAEAIDKEKKKLSDATCAYLTIYYPEYTQGFSGELKYFITVNDTSKIEIWADTKYVLKITKPCSIKLKVDQNHFKQDMNVDVKMGNNYYVRSYVNFPGANKNLKTGEYEVHVNGFTPYMEKIDEQQGAFESSMVTRYVVAKNLTPGPSPQVERGE